MLLVRPGRFSTGKSSALAAGALFLLGLVAGAAIGPIGLSRGKETAETRHFSPAVPPIVPQGRHSADVLRVIDGDTFEARVHIWPGLDVTTLVRLRGIDAPEIKARCGDEYIKAQSAREALAALLTQGGVQITNVEPDKAGSRVVADAATPTTSDVSQALLNAGVVRHYDGDRRDVWCP